MSNSKELKFDTINRDKFNEVQNKTQTDPNSIKGQLIRKLNELDTESDALVIPYSKDSRFSYYKGIIYGENKTHKDDRDYKFSIANDKEEQKLYVMAIEKE